MYLNHIDGTKQSSVRVNYNVNQIIDKSHLHSGKTIMKFNEYQFVNQPDSIPTFHDILVNYTDIDPEVVNDGLIDIYFTFNEQYSIMNYQANIFY